MINLNFTYIPSRKIHLKTNINVISVSFNLHSLGKENSKNNHLEKQYFPSR